MSLDFTLKIDNEEIFDANMTHDVTPMWHKAGCYDALYMSDGQKAMDVRDIIVDAVVDMMKYKKEYQKLDSPNGWGTYDDAFKFLLSVAVACCDFPEAIIGVDK